MEVAEENDKSSIAISDSVYQKKLSKNSLMNESKQSSEILNLNRAELLNPPTLITRRQNMLSDKSKLEGRQNLLARIRKGSMEYPSSVMEIILDRQKTENILDSSEDKANEDKANFIKYARKLRSNNSIITDLSDVMFNVEIQ
jgi:hypothetical protein